MGMKGVAAVVAGGALLISCNGGLGSCAGLISPGTSFPSRKAQGSEPVDEGLRLRLTERGLDVLLRNFGAILKSRFPPDPSNPEVARLPLPSHAFVDANQQGFGLLDICLQGNTEPPPPGCVTATEAGMVSALTLDLAQLDSRLSADFISTPENGVRITGQGLLLGLDGRFRTAVNVGPVNSDADCDLHGQTTLPPDGEHPWPWGTLGRLDLTVDVLPRVSMDPAACRKGATPCLAASVVVRHVELQGLGLTVDLPPRCENGGPLRCSKACSDIAVDVGLCGLQSQCHNPFTMSGNPMCPDPIGDCECQLLCPVYGFGTDLVVQITNFLLGALEPLLETIFTEAVNEALGGINGQPLAFNGRMELAALAGGRVTSLSSATALGLMVAPHATTFAVTCPPGGTVDCGVRQGMDVVLQTGFEAVHAPLDGHPAPHSCVPVLTGADFMARYGAVAFEAPDAPPLSGEYVDSLGAAHTYDVAVSVARASLNQLGWAVFNSGALCLGVDSWAIHALNGGTLELTAGALDLLMGGRLTQLVEPRAPLYVALAPLEPPLFTLGAGTPEDPHVQLSLRGLRVSIYVWMYERYARLFEVQTDVAAGFNAAVGPGPGDLSLVLAHGPRVTNLREHYNELFPDIDWGAILPAIVNVALSAMPGADLRFSVDVAPLLANVAGVPLSLALEAVQVQPPQDRREFLELYFSLSGRPAEATAPPAPLGLTAALEPGTFTRRPQETPRATGHARLVGSSGPLPLDRLFSYQVDFGPWHAPIPPQADGTLLVKDEKLALAGRHAVRVRALPLGLAGAGVESTEVTVWTDAEPPRVLLLGAPRGGVMLRVVDNVAANNQLEMRWRVDGADWHPWSPLRELTAEEVEGARALDVEVRDPAGNVSRRSSLALGATPSEVAPNGTGREAGCCCGMARPTCASFSVFLLMLWVVGTRQHRHGRRPAASCTATRGGEVTGTRSRH